MLLTFFLDFIIMVLEYIWLRIHTLMDLILILFYTSHLKLLH